MRFPSGPPPLYKTCQEQSLDDSKKQTAVDLFNVKGCGNISLAFEDPPSYKEKEFLEESIIGFHHLSPMIIRPWKSFFSTCLKWRWSVSADNFTYNLSYYHINYAWIMLAFVMIALVVIDSDEFRFCVLWSSIAVLFVYLLNLSGCSPELLGRKLPFSEQLTALIVFELLFYGLFPGAVPFVYFIVLFCGFVVVHACLTPAKMAVLKNYQIQHV